LRYLGRRYTLTERQLAEQVAVRGVQIRLVLPVG
jgi:hypothetical protein